jgi:hypothetical protein
MFYLLVLLYKLRGCVSFSLYPLMCVHSFDLASSLSSSYTCQRVVSFLLVLPMIWFVLWNAWPWPLSACKPSQMHARTIVHPKPKKTLKCTQESPEACMHQSAPKVEHTLLISHRPSQTHTRTIVHPNSKLILLSAYKPNQAHVHTKVHLHM